MATKSPTQFHNHWGSFANQGAFPGLISLQDGLEVGDTAYSIADGQTFVCTSNALPATWSAMGGGGAPISSVSLGSAYTYTQAVAPVEEVTGNGSFNGNLVGSLTAYFKASITNVWAVTGGGETTRVRLYDIGPAAGPPDVSPRLVTELTFSAQGGPRAAEQALIVVPLAPATNQILDQDRMYEVAVIQDISTAGDVGYLGSAGVEVR